ncbi:MAG: hypothetical protein ABEK04_06265 [Candidatus Nanohalobium sp.]
MVLMNTLILNNQKVIEEQMMNYRTQELGMNIEMISDYQNPGVMRIDFPVRYNILFENMGPSKTNMTLRYNKKHSEITIDVGLEPQSYGEIDSTENLCIREDLPRAGFFSSFPTWLVGASDTDGDLEDSSTGYETGWGVPEGGDQFVQVYNTTTYGGAGCR